MYKFLRKPLLDLQLTPLTFKVTRNSHTIKQLEKYRYQDGLQAQAKVEIFRQQRGKGQNKETPARMFVNGISFRKKKPIKVTSAPISGR